MSAETMTAPTTPIDLEALKAAAEAFGDEQWRALGQSVMLVHEGDPVRIAEANPDLAFEDEHAGRVAALIALANPATILALLSLIAEKDGAK